MPLLQQAREIFSNYQSHLDVALCDQILAMNLHQRDELTGALELLQQTRAHLLNLGAHFFAARTASEIGIVLRRLDRAEEAREVTQTARDYFASQKIFLEVSTCDINLGNIYDTLSRYEDAITFYEHAASFPFVERRARRNAVIQGNIGLIYQKLGRYAESVQFIEYAPQISQDANLSKLNIAPHHLNIAPSYGNLGHSAKALEHLQQALDIFASLTSDEYIVETLIALAELHISIREMAEAEIELNQALSLCSEKKFPSWRALAQELLAQIVGRRDERAQARALLAASRATLTELARVVDRARVDLTEGELNLGWKEPAWAREYFEQTLPILAPRFPDLAWRAHFGIARCADAAADPNTALARVLDAARTIRLSRATIGAEEYGILFYAQRELPFEWGLQLAQQLNAPLAALELIEASKAQTLVAYLQQRGSEFRMWRDDSRVAPLVKRAEEIARESDALSRRLQFRAPKEPSDVERGANGFDQASAAFARIDALREEHQRLVTQIRLTAPGFAGISETEPVDLEEFRAAMIQRFGARWLAIDYYSKDNSLIIVTVTADDAWIEWKKLCARDLDALNECCAMDTPAAPAAEADCWQRAYRLPVPPAFDSDTLILSPHGALHALPFQALRNGESYLIQDCAVVYTPNLHAMKFLLADSVAPKKFRALVVGLSDFQGQQNALPSAELELNELKKSFGQQANYFWNQAATRENILRMNESGELGEFIAIHFATHTSLDPTMPYQSPLVLRDRALTTASVLNLNLNAAWVTLSGCESALAKAGAAMR